MDSLTSIRAHENISRVLRIRGKDVQLADDTRIGRENTKCNGMRYVMTSRLATITFFHEIKAYISDKQLLQRK